MSNITISSTVGRMRVHEVSLEWILGARNYQIGISVDESRDIEFPITYGPKMLKTICTSVALPRRHTS